MRRLLVCIHQAFLKRGRRITVFKAFSAMYSSLQPCEGLLAAAEVAGRKAAGFFARGRLADHWR